MGGTVTWTGSDGSNPTVWSVAANWSAGAGGTAPPASDDDVIIANVTNDPVLDAPDTINSLVIQSGGNLDGDGNVLTVGGESSATGYAVQLLDGSIITGTDTDITLTGSHGTDLDLVAGTGNLRHLVVNKSGDEARLNGATTLSGNLTITAGTLTCNAALTVAGTTTIGDGSASATEATLTCNDSAHSFGSGVTSGYAVIIEVGGFFNGGTGAHTMGSFKVAADNALAKATLSTGVTTINAKSNDSNKAFRIAGSSAGFDDGNGTVKFTYAGAIGVQTSTKSLYDVIVSHASCDITLVDALTVARNLTITAGELDTSGSNFALTVAGIVTNNATLNANASALSVGGIRTQGTGYTGTGTITITGTGGILEGNLDDANVDVNLDAVLDFDGAGDYVDTGTGLGTALGDSYAGDLSVSLWFKADVTDGNDGLFNIGSFSNHKGELMISLDANQIRVKLNNDGWRKTVAFTDTTSWHHLCFVWDASTEGNSLLYLDGVATGSASGSFPSSFDLDGLKTIIGGFYNSDYTFDGQIADVRIYNNDLGATEVGILASKIGVDNAVVQSTDTRVGHWMLTATDSGSDLTSFVGGSSSTVTLPVTDGDDFIDNDYQRILVENEVLRITGISGNNLTVATRSGADLHGTTLEDLSDDADVYIIGLEDLSTNNNSPVLYGNLTTPSTNLDFDAFSVNVQDPYDGSDAATRTQTDGTFTVTQGKLECLSLSSVDFNGTDTRIDTSSSFTLSHDNSTMAMWVKKDNATGNVDALAGLSSDANQSMARIFSNGEVNLKKYPNNLTTSTVIADTNWHHIIYTLNGDNNGAIYIDGVAQALSSNAITADLVLNTFGMRATSTDPFDGKMRDVKVFDYVLSADQAASLYSGSYHVTPKHWWKLDEGHATAALNNAAGAFEDSGTGTDIDGQGVNLVDASGVNGTLDLDSTLTIDTTGTLSAPRGDLDLANHFTDNGTFTHNNGEVKMTGGGRDLTGSAATVFYKLSTHNYTLLLKSFTVEHTLSASGSNSWKFNQNLTVTMGTETSSGTISTGTAAEKGLRFSTASKTIKFAAADTSGLNPWTATDGGAGWNIQASSVKVQLENGDIQFAFETDPEVEGDAGTYELTGDMEFDAFTISANDTLDLNGKRATFSGGLWVSGSAILTDGGDSSLIHITGTSTLRGGIVQWCFGHHDEDPSITLGNTDMIISGGAASMKMAGTANDFARTVLISGSGAQKIDSGVGFCPTNLIAASEINTNASGNHKITTTNLTIPTSNPSGSTVAEKGGVLTANESTLTVAGDFTTSGGLLGASCVTLDGSDDTIESASFADDRNTVNNGDYTIEFWFKRAAISSGTEYFFDFLNWSGSAYTHNNRSACWIEADGQIFWHSRQGAGSVHPTPETSAGFDDDKWHHVALVFKGRGGSHTGTYANGAKEIWVDGKLESRVEGGQTGTSGGTELMDYVQGTTMYMMIGFNKKDSSNYFEGQLDEFRMWSDARTQAEIRDNMFTEVAPTADHLRHQWSFNDGGTETTVQDLATDAVDEAHLDVVLTSKSGGSATALWAGAGTFDYDESTLVMANSGTQYINFLNGEDVYNLTVNDGSTTELSCLNDSGGTLDLYGDLIVNEKLRSASSGSTNSNILFRAVKTITVADGTGAASDVRTTALSDLYRIMLHHNGGTIDVPELTTKRLFVSNGGSGAIGRATGNVTITEELEVSTGTTFNANGNTINTAEVDVNGGTLNLTSSTLNFATAGQEWNMSSSATLTTGNTTVTGYSSGNPTTISLPDTSPSSSNFEIVGNVSNLKASTLTDLTVIGSVTNCITAGTDAIIRQWHHTLDTQQLLDADSAGDDDLRLTKSALDNSHELMTG